MTEQTVYRADLMQPTEGETLMPEEEEASIDYAALLRKLNRGRRTIGAVTLGVLAIATVAAFLIAPRYTSKASFIPPNSSSTSSAAALVGQLSQFAGVGAGSLLGGVKSQGDLYVGILKSRSIGSELVQRFNLKSVYKVKKESQAEKALASHSAFDVGVKDSIVTISVTDKSPDPSPGSCQCLSRCVDKDKWSPGSYRGLPAATLLRSTTRKGEGRLRECRSRPQENGRTIRTNCSDRANSH